jgi:ribonuclease HI
MQHFHLFTDGSALAYANCGGWAYVLQGPKGETTQNGACWNVGSNTMELWAVLEGLAKLVTPSTVTIYTDSQFVIAGSINRRFKDPIWREMYCFLDIHTIIFCKIIGNHSTHKKVHNLAREAAFDAIHSGRPTRNRKLQSA